MRSVDHQGAQGAGPHSYRARKVNSAVHNFIPPSPKARNKSPIAHSYQLAWRIGARVSITMVTYAGNDGFCTGCRCFGYTFCLCRGYQTCMEEYQACMEGGLRFNQPGTHSFRTLQAKRRGFITIFGALRMRESGDPAVLGARGPPRPPTPPDRAPNSATNCWRGFALDLYISLKFGRSHVYRHRRFEEMNIAIGCAHE